MLRFLNWLFGSVRARQKPENYHPLVRCVTRALRYHMDWCIDHVKGEGPQFDFEIWVHEPSKLKVVYKYNLLTGYYFQIYPGLICGHVLTRDEWDAIERAFLEMRRQKALSLFIIAEEKST